MSRLGVHLLCDEAVFYYLVYVFLFVTALLLKVTLLNHSHWVCGNLIMRSCMIKHIILIDILVNNG